MHITPNLKPYIGNISLDAKIDYQVVFPGTIVEARCITDSTYYKAGGHGSP